MFALSDDNSAVWIDFTAGHKQAVNQTIWIDDNQLKELPAFQHWLRRVYMPVHLPRYLSQKYGKAATRLIYTENGQLSDEVLALTEIKEKSLSEAVKLRQFLAVRHKQVDHSSASRWQNENP